MSKSISARINLGVGDHIFARVFLDGVKHEFFSIQITHAEDAIHYWFNNDPKRRAFNTALGKLVFRDPPYVLVPGGNLPFFPNERIVRELNAIPVKPNLDHLAAGKSLDINPYIVITTKARQFPKATFNQIKDQLSSSLRNLSDRFTIVILGERDVQRTREYEAEVNRDQVFGIYDFLISVLPKDKILDLSVPALGISVSSIEQFRQDCLIMKEAKTVITLGIGGNFWMSAGLAQNTIGLRADNEWTTDIMTSANYPNMTLTKDIGAFANTLSALI